MSCETKKNTANRPSASVFVEKANFDVISEDMETIDQLLASRESPNDISSNDVESMWETFKTTLSNSMEKNIPSKLVSKNKNSLPWINTATRRALRKKQNPNGKLNVRATTKIGHSLENSAAHWKDVFANNTGTTFLALLAPLLKQTTANPFGTM